MEDLINRLQNAHGLTKQQSAEILHTITGYIKEQFPMVSGAIDNLFQSGTTPAGGTMTPEDVNESVADPIHDGGDFMDKISDYVPGATGPAADDNVGEDIDEMFGKNKKI